MTDKADEKNKNWAELSDNDGEDDDAQAQQQN